MWGWQLTDCYSCNKIDFMNVSDAVQVAISDTKKLFESESLSNLGLEEVAFDDASEEWIVTVGFSRPWDYPKTNTGAFAAALGTQMVRPERSFKIVRVKDSDGKVVSVKNYATGSID